MNRRSFLGCRCAAVALPRLLHAMLIVSLLLVPVCGYGAEGFTPDTRYREFFARQGLGPNDALVHRMHEAQLPAELFKTDPDQPVQAVILIDMLAFYYLGYRTATLQARSGDRAWTVGYVEKNQQLSERAALAPEEFDRYYAALAKLEPLTPDPRVFGGPQGTMAIYGHRGSQTYDVPDDAPKGGRKFAGYIGVLTLYERGKPVRQMLITPRDFIEPALAEGRAPEPGRLMRLGEAAKTGKPISLEDDRQRARQRDLFAAAARGDVDAVSKLVADGTDLNLQASDGWSALMFAAGRGHEAIVRRLLEHGAKPELMNKENDNALTLAARSGSLAVVRALVEAGAVVNPEAQGRTPEPPLAAAIARKANDITEYLLEHGADPNRKGKHGTPLVAAVKNRDRALVERLLAKGADPNLADDFNYLQNNPLITAIIEAGPDAPDTTAIVRALIAAGADVNFANIKSIVHERCSTPLSLASERAPQLVPIIEAAGGNDHARTACLAEQERERKERIVRAAPGRALLLAAARGDVATLGKLIADGVNPNEQRDANRTTPLTFAATRGHVAAVTLLLDQKPDPRSITEALIRVVRGQQPFLNEEGEAYVPDVDVTQLKAAVRLLIERGVDTNAMLAVVLATGDKLGIADELLRRGARNDAVDRDGNTVLMTALEHAGNDRAVEALFASGVDVNAKNKFGVTSLMIAASNGSVASLKALLARGADVHARNVNGNTALFYAVLAGRADAVRVLIHAGAKVDDTNAKGETPLSLAQGADDIATILKGATNR